MVFWRFSGRPGFAGVTCGVGAGDATNTGAPVCFELKRMSSSQLVGNKMTEQTHPALAKSIFFGIKDTLGMFGVHIARPNSTSLRFGIPRLALCDDQDIFASITIEQLHSDVTEA